MAMAPTAPANLQAARSTTSKLDQIVAKARKSADARMSGYREQSLKLHPQVCGRCGREFTRENLHELTVHHKGSQPRQQSARRQQLGKSLHVLPRLGAPEVFHPGARRGARDSD